MGDIVGTSSVSQRETRGRRLRLRQGRTGTTPGWGWCRGGRDHSACWKAVPQSRQTEGPLAAPAADQGMIAGQDKPRKANSGQVRNLKNMSEASRKTAAMVFSLPVSSHKNHESKLGWQNQTSRESSHRI